MIICSPYCRVHCIHISRMGFESPTVVVRQLCDKVASEAAFATDALSALPFVLLHKVPQCSSHAFLHMVCTVLLLNIYEAVHFGFIDSIVRPAVTITKHGCIPEAMKQEGALK